MRAHCGAGGFYTRRVPKGSRLLFLYPAPLFDVFPSRSGSRCIVGHSEAIQKRASRTLGWISLTATRNPPGQLLDLDENSTPRFARYRSHLDRYFGRGGFREFSRAQDESACDAGQPSGQRYLLGSCLGLAQLRRGTRLK